MNQDVDLMGYITVKLFDEATFKFAFKSTTTAPELVRQVCERGGINQTQYFGLKRLRNLRSNLKEEQIPKIWISEKLPLFAQGCDSSTTLYLSHKYWFFEVDELVDPHSAQVIYDETDAKLMGNECEASEDITIQLAAIRAQLQFGDYKKEKKLSEKMLKKIIPEYIFDTHFAEDWDRLIGVFHEKLKGLSTEELHKKYLALAKDQLPSLLTVFFPAQYSTKEMNSKVRILVGVNLDGIGIYSFNNGRKRLQVFHRYRDLVSWSTQPMWNGQESPSYKRPPPTDLEYEKDALAYGPYCSSLFLKTKIAKARELQIEIVSFLSEDDVVLSFLDTYKARLEQFLSLLSLDDERKDALVQVSTLEGVSKKIRISYDTNGQELIAIFAEKINLQDSSFFQLSAVTDGCDKWIALKDPVLANGVTSATPLILKVRFFWKNPVDVTDPVARGLYFCQLHLAMVQGDFLVKPEPATELASLYCQYTYGSYDKKKKYGYQNSSSVKEFIPFICTQAKDFSASSWSKRITSVYEKMVGMSKEDCLVKYLATCGSQPNYGITLFDAIIPKTDEQCFIGVGKHGIALFKQENTDLITSYRFGYELRNYANDGEAIALRVRPSKNAEEKIVEIISLQFSNVMDLMGYYQKMRQYEKDQHHAD